MDIPSAFQAEWEMAKRLPTDLIAGGAKRLNEIVTDPDKSLSDVGVGFAIGSGLILLSKCPGGTALVKGFAQPMVAVAAGVDLGNRLTPAADLFRDPTKVEQVSKEVGYNLGSMVVEYPLMAAGGMGSLSASRALGGESSRVASLLRNVMPTAQFRPALALATEGGGAGLSHMSSVKTEIGYNRPNVRAEVASDKAIPAVEFPKIGEKVVKFDEAQIKYAGTRAEIETRLANITHDPTGVKIAMHDGSTVTHSSDAVTVRTAGGDKVVVGRGNPRTELSDGTVITFGDSTLPYAIRTTLKDGTELETLGLEGGVRVKQTDGTSTVIKPEASAERQAVHGDISLVKDKYGSFALRLPDNTEIGGFMLYHVGLKDGTTISSRTVDLPNGTKISKDDVKSIRADHPLNEGGKALLLTTQMTDGTTVSKLGSTLLTRLEDKTQLYMQNERLVTRSNEDVYVTRSKDAVTVRQPDGVETTLSDDGRTVVEAGSKLPPFTPLGYLPEGQFQATWPEFVKRFDTSPERHELLERLEPRLIHLKETGVQEVAIGGSFVTTKAKPNDVDGLFDPQGVNFERLKSLDLPLGMQDPALQRRTYPGINFAEFASHGTTYDAAKRFFQVSREVGVREGGNMFRKIRLGEQKIGLIVLRHDGLPSEPLKELHRMISTDA